MAEPWILGKLPKIEIYLVSEKILDKITTTSISNRGRSRGVLVIDTLPWITQVKDQRTSSTKRATEIRISLGVSKNSVVSGKKNRGVKVTTAIIKAVMALLR